MSTKCGQLEDRKMELKHPFATMAGVVLLTLALLLFQLSTAVPLAA